MNRKNVLFFSMIGLFLFILVCTACEDETPTYNEFEWRVFELTNIERTNQGIPALRWDDRLGAAARAHSEDMVKNNFRGHTGSDGSSVGQRITRAGFEWRICAENIAYGHRTPEAAVAAWMNSPDHRRNILNASLTHLGVGVVENRWTQKFATPR